MSGNQLRFYLAPGCKKSNQFISDESTFCHQLKNVLRLKPGNQIILFTGDGSEYSCNIQELNPKSFLAEVRSSEQFDQHKQPQIHLYQSIPKKDSKFELICEKATELGVTSITPITTEHTQKKELRKTDRLQKIIIEAAEQSGRVTLPQLNPIIGLQEALLSAPGIRIILDNNVPSKPLDPFVFKTNDLSIFIGPEGGFSPKEISSAQAQDYQVFSLGRFTLRTETAAIATISLASILACQK